MNDVCDSAIDIIKSIQVQDQKGTLNKFFTFDCWASSIEKMILLYLIPTAPALWSWVYYISIPNNAPPLYFDEAKFKVYPKSDEIILFPGHVRHEVQRRKHDRRKNCSCWKHLLRLSKHLV